ncbi:hypothetical protein SGCZBJ_17745 [Caulobacter zeae]|uniref:Secretin/TonB short N-terminal domain-containing protein n=1 Tax=Caulobacter zeae TaxID=2055137 RepID=A0A2N5D984_9CAUL|nr:hypothetical protein SGCZBJ_17745 [Caulobacter zeae]
MNGAGVRSPGSPKRWRSGDDELGRHGLSILAFATALGLASTADARGLLGGARIVIKEGRLADALRDLSVRTGSDLLFAPDVVGELRNKRIAGDLQVEPILSRLLEGTGLSYRRVGDGTYIVYRPEREQPTALPEVLVIGRKAQNADIRRTQNDIQGYRVATSADIRSSHVDNLDQFLRSRQSNNAERFGPASDPREGYASNRSELNFHGLGPNQTLVLVDGTRMPSTLSQFFALELNQPDVNGLPLLAIDRIETLTGTAGGIYGPGATGGVVNVILKRDYRGAEISTAYGLTDRGDGRRRRVDGRIGFTPDDGATDIMINVSRAESDGLRFGDRDFVQRARLADIAQNPAGLRYTFADGVIISSLYGENLKLSPALGGASLGSTFTYLPLGVGVGVGDGSIMRANAGKVPDALSPDGNGVLRSLTSSTTATSLLFNARHRFGQHVEAVVDFIGWENEGRSVSGFNITGWQTGWPAVMRRQPGRPVTDAFPFAQPVELVFPFPGMEAHARNRMRTLRASAKVIFDLPASWRGEANYSVGETRNRFREEGFAFDQNFPLSMFLMQPGANGEPTPEPLGSWADFVATIQAYKIPHTVLFERKLRLGDFAVRLGGPLLRRAAGDVALSLSAERRVEKASLTPWDENGSFDHDDIPLRRAARAGPVARVDTPPPARAGAASGRSLRRQPGRHSVDGLPGAAQPIRQGRHGLHRRPARLPPGRPAPAGQHRHRRVASKPGTDVGGPHHPAGLSTDRPCSWRTTGRTEQYGCSSSTRIDGPPPGTGANHRARRRLQP